MNSDDLLNIINIIIKNEEKLEESPDEIYSLFKKHGYEGDIETLKLDLKNLLDDVIKSDEELSKVAGGKVSKLAAGAVAALTCFPMNSFASGTANTNQNKHSAVNKITDSIKSGAKKVGDATKEYVIEPAKDAAKTIARNPGKSVAVTGALVVYGLLSGLAGKKLASPPKVDTQGMTEDEKQKVDETYKVLKELTEKSLIEMSGHEFSWNLTGLPNKPEGLNGNKIKIGELAAKLMPKKVTSDAASDAYTSARTKYIEYETATLNALKQTVDKLKAQHEQELKKNQEDTNKKLEEAQKEAGGHASKYLYDNYKTFVRVPETPNMLTEKHLTQWRITGSSNPESAIRSKLRQFVPKLITGCYENLDEKSFVYSTITSTKKLGSIKDICLGDAFPLIIGPNRNLSSNADNRQNYMEKDFFQTNVTDKNLIDYMKTADFWTRLLLNERDKSHEPGYKNVKVVSAIIYCLLWGTFSVDYWVYAKNVLAGIQNALLMASKYDQKGTKLLHDCLAKINIKFENGFLKWKDPDLK